MADELNKSIITPVEIEAEMKKSYLDYAMSVIVGRALPDVRDGLKPVQRRILVAMNDLGLTSNPTASAPRLRRSLGNYHPHGDAAVYDALVRLAQAFNMRYPLIDGQGNLRLGGRRSSGGHALHRSAPGENQRGNARRHRKRNRRFRSQLRPDATKNRSCSHPSSQSSRQRRKRHRRRHGHQHPAAQPGRSHRRRHPADRKAGRHPQGSDEAGSRPGFPDGRLHFRPRRNRERLQDRARQLHMRAKAAIEKPARTARASSSPKFPTRSTRRA